MVTTSGVIKFMFAYSLSFFYSTLVAIAIAYKYFLSYDKKFFERKERSVKPAVLSSTEFGEHKFVTVNGVKLHYVEKGDKTKPLMVFVHGFPEFWYSWRYQIKEFSKDYWTITIDQRGYGDSEKPTNIADYHVNNMVEDIRQLVKAMGRERFTLVAHDWGAVVSWRFVTKHMDMLDNYVMIGAPSSPVWNKLVVATWKQFKMSWYIFFFQMPMLPEYSVGLNDMTRFSAMDVSADDLEVYKYTFGKKDAFTGPINYYRANMKFLFPEPKLKRPLKFSRGLFLLGENDYFISKDSAPLLQKYFVNLDFKVVKGANHFAQQHKPEETNRLIREFLNKK